MVVILTFKYRAERANMCSYKGASRTGAAKKNCPYSTCPTGFKALILLTLGQ